MKSTKSATVAPIRTQSPLSSFLSSLMEDRFGTAEASSKIVVDNPSSHSPFPTIPSTMKDTVEKSISIARTTSSSSSTVSSSRWDPNAFPSANKRNSTLGGRTYGKHSEIDGPYDSRSTSSWSSSDVLAVPVRYDSPQQRSQKQTMVTDKKSIKRDTDTTTAASSSTMRSAFGGGTEADLDSSSMLPTCPIRQVSLNPHDLFLSQTQSNLVQASMDRSRRPSLSPKKKKKTQSPRNLSVSPMKTKKALQGLTALPTSLEAAAGSEATTKVAWTPPPSMTPVPSPPRIKKRDDGENEAVRSVGIPSSFRFPILGDDETDDRDDAGGSLLNSVATSRRRRRPFLSPRPKRSMLQPYLPNARDVVLEEMFPPTSTVVCPEDSTMLSASASIPPSVASPPPLADDNEGSEAGEEPGALPIIPKVPFGQEASRPLAFARQRSLSETLLSCDRDTIDPCSPSLPSGFAPTSAERNRDRKRAPPVQPIRQLSIALFESI